MLRTLKRYVKFNVVFLDSLFNPRLEITGYLQFSFRISIHLDFSFDRETLGNSDVTIWLFQRRSTFYHFNPEVHKGVDDVHGNRGKKDSSTRIVVVEGRGRRVVVVGPCRGTRTGDEGAFPGGDSRLSSLSSVSD